MVNFTLALLWLLLMAKSCQKAPCLYSGLVFFVTPTRYDREGEMGFICLLNASNVPRQLEWPGR